MLYKYDCSLLVSTILLMRKEKLMSRIFFFFKDYQLKSPSKYLNTPEDVYIWMPEALRFYVHTSNASTSNYPQIKLPIDQT